MDLVFRYYSYLVKALLYIFFHPKVQVRGTVFLAVGEGNVIHANSAYGKSLILVLLDIIYTIYLC